MTDTFTKIISADSHVFEPLDIWEKAIGGRFGDITPKLHDEFDGRKGKFFFAGRQTLDITGIDKQQDRLGSRRHGFIPEERVEFQKNAGIDAEVMIATMMMIIMQSEDKEALKASAEVYNDWLIEFCSYDPKRLVGVGMVPTADVDWAIGELERTAKAGFKGMVINLIPPEGCPPYRSSVYDPLWARAEEMGIPVMLHSVTGRVPDPLHFHEEELKQEAPGYIVAVFDEIRGVLINDFIFGTILDRFPKMKLLAVEFEVSWLPHIMWRVEQIQTDFGPRLNLPKLKLPKASDYFTERMWHGVISDPYAKQTIPLIGADRIMWGSDYPHNIAIGLEAQKVLSTAFDTLPFADQEKIVWQTATEIYGLQ